MPTLRHVLCFSILLTLCHSVCAVGSSERQVFDIKPQALSEALADFAKQSGLRVLRRDRRTDAAEVISPHVKGEFSAEEALSLLLKESGWTYEFVSQRTVRIRPIAAPQSFVTTSRGIDHRARALLPSPSTRPAATAGAAEEETIQEVVVTAQKRLERLQDVPVPVTALSAAALVNSNRLRLQDFYATVPGLNLISSSKGDAFISIRGLTTGATAGNPTVGITIDDVPYGSSSGYGAGGLGVPAPDIDPSDLLQVEVLRGPQGTLYGASSIGGLLKYVTNDPSLDALSGRVQSGVSAVRNGSQAGYVARGSVNLPLSDQVAIRASGFARSDPGYIDDEARGIDGLNRTDVSGGRLAVLWRPSESLALKANALFQDVAGHGSSDVEPALGDLRQQNLRGTGRYDKQTQLYSAVLTAQIDSAELTVASGYSIHTDTNTMDFSSVYGAIVLEGAPGSGFDGFGVNGAALVNDFRTSKFTQELRLALPGSARLDWLLGAFYTQESSRVDQRVLGVDPESGTSVGSLLRARWPTSYVEYAAFADLTLHVTDRFDVQLGGRQSYNRQTYSEVDEGPFGPTFFGVPDPVVIPEIRTEESSFTYLVTPRFKLSPNVMLYARFASGYRAGGPNSTGVLFDLPKHFEPDKTQNYEIGAKAELLGSLLSVDTSLYYIDWQDIQLNVFDPASSANYFINGSRARSRGIELAVGSRPKPNLTISAWVSWNDAVLTEAFPTTATLIGAAGDRLPSSARFSGHVALDQELALGGDVLGFYGASLVYVGSRRGAFVPIGDDPRRQELPAYAQIDVHAGVKREPWVISAFVSNLADERGVIAGGLGSFDPGAFTYIQPRTLGMSVAWRFGGAR